MPTYKTEAIVLKRLNWGETDRIVSLFTKHYGKIRAIARGVRRITSKKAPHLEVFTHSLVFLASGKSLDTIIEARTVNNFAAIRQSLPLAVASFWLIEEVERLCAERERIPVVFELLVSALNRLAQSSLDWFKIEREVERFSLSLLWELGYLPRNQVLKGVGLNQFIEDVLEGELKSRRLIC